MKVVITGATGFIGSHLVRRFSADGNEVAIVVRPSSDLSILGATARSIKVFEYDGSTDSIVRVFADFSPTLVCHVASCVLSTHQPSDIVRLVEGNLLFGTQLLEAMSLSRCRRLVNTGTFWQHYMNENYNPVCLYAATKQAFADIIKYYSEARNLHAVTLEFSDTYGAGDPRQKLMNILRKAALDGESLLMTPGEQILDLVHVDDVVEAFLVAAERTADGFGTSEVFAVSSGERLSLRELVSLFQETSGKKLDVQFGARPYREREVMTLWDKGVPLPDWKPVMTLRDGIRKLTWDM